MLNPGGPDGATYESFADYWRELSFIVYLLASILAVLSARRQDISGSIGSWMVAVGYTLITFGVVVGLAVREELDWFFVVAGPGLLISTLGYAAFGVSIWRRSSLPRWAAVMAGIGGMVAILMSELGTGVLIGSFWLYVALNVPARLKAPWSGRGRFALGGG